MSNWKKYGFTRTVETDDGEEIDYAVIFNYHPGYAQTRDQPGEGPEVDIITYQQVGGIVVDTSKWEDEEQDKLRDECITHVESMNDYYDGRDD